MRQKLFLSAALIGLAIGPALAQTPGTGTTGTGTSPTTSPPQMAAVPSDAIMGSRLSDMSVRNQQDENVGEIDDFVVDQQGKIHQVVIQTGGVLGMGGKKVALPWDQVRIDTSRRVAVVSMSQDQMKNMPEFQSPDRDRGNAPARSGGGTGGTTGTGGTGTTRP